MYSIALYFKPSIGCNKSKSSVLFHLLEGTERESGRGTNLFLLECHLLGFRRRVNRFGWMHLAELLGNELGDVVGELVGLNIEAVDLGVYMLI